MAADPYVITTTFVSLFQAITQTAREIYELPYNNRKAVDSIETAKDEIDHLTNNITIIQECFDTIVPQHCFEFDRKLLHQEIRHIYAQLERRKKSWEYLRKRHKKRTSKLFPKTLISETQSLIESLREIGVSANTIFPQLKNLQMRIEHNFGGRLFNMGTQYGSHSSMERHIDISFERRLKVLFSFLRTASTFENRVGLCWLDMTDTSSSLSPMAEEDARELEGYFCLYILTEAHVAVLVKVFSEFQSCDMYLFTACLIGTFGFGKLTMNFHRSTTETGMVGISSTEIDIHGFDTMVLSYLKALV